MKLRSNVASFVTYPNLSPSTTITTAAILILLPQFLGLCPLLHPLLQYSPPLPPSPPTLQAIQLGSRGRYTT